jgi:hypothetical protein
MMIITARTFGAVLIQTPQFVSIGSVEVVGRAVVGRAPSFLGATSSIIKSPTSHIQTSNLSHLILLGHAIGACVRAAHGYFVATSVPIEVAALPRTVTIQLRRVQFDYKAFWTFHR